MFRSNVARAFAATLLITGSAAANPRPLPFSYIYETLAEGETELEQYVDFVPTKARATSGKAAWYGATQMQTEFEHGITNRLELGLYVTYAPGAGSDISVAPQLTGGNGFKQRLRYRLAEGGEWPIDVALYGEVTENQREIELEAKIILQKRVGPVRMVTNLWAEREFYFDGHAEWVLNPTAGVTFEATPAFQPGIEYWMRAELEDEDEAGPRPFAAGPHHYLGPTMLLSFGKLWWSSGVYYRLNEPRRALDPGDAYGHVWARTVIGVGL